MGEDELLTRLEQLEQALFGGKVEDQFFEEEATSKVLFDDVLEKLIFFILLELALDGRRGVTSALIAEMTDKNNNTVHVRLERLYYKLLIQKQQIGMALLYYIPLHERLLSAVTKEIVRLKLAQGELQAETTAEELEKTILAKYLTDVQTLLGCSQEYFANLSKGTNYRKLSQKKNLL
ncbi:MAG: hypothetical protein ACFFCZ_31685 [Promethearchaeota archaeon]